MSASILEKLGVIANAVDVRLDSEGTTEVVLQPSEFAHVVKWTEVLRAEGFSYELDGDKRIFRRGLSYLVMKPVSGGGGRFRIRDVSQCPSARITEGGVDWAGVRLFKQHDGILVAGPVWRHVETWSIAHYFWGPIDYASAIPLIGSQLREQSPRVVGPWTLPEQVWFDVRALGADAKVRLKPSSLGQAHYLFERDMRSPEDPDVPGVLIEITGAERIV